MLLSIIISPKNFLLEFCHKSNVPFRGIWWREIVLSGNTIGDRHFAKRQHRFRIKIRDKSLIVQFDWLYRLHRHSFCGDFCAMTYLLHKSMSHWCGEREDKIKANISAVDYRRSFSKRCDNNCAIYFISGFWSQTGSRIDKLTTLVSCRAIISGRFISLLCSDFPPFPRQRRPLSAYWEIPWLWLALQIRCCRSVLHLILKYYQFNWPLVCERQINSQDNWVS